MSIRPMGDRALLVEFADNEQVQRAAAATRADAGHLLAEIVPGHRTLLLVWARPPADRAIAQAAARAPAGAGEAAGDAPEPLVVPVTYDGPDLDHVASLTGMSPEEVVRRHAGAEYRVGFVGFAPGFGYLLGGDRRLRVARREEPRERVPAGSVAVAAEYSAVYPRASPGGWQLLGRTELKMFDPDRDPPALLAPGRGVRFRVAP